ncbi:MAG: class I SAM-dependent methyltransferase [Aulosira sp. ZfuVER01]|nr:class I SAM-dependent methyltransferase [Aulosira sp. ZfuVER01]MDZ7999229.1 class I SAM-dependent methyltransferase [Aulosira sp. DedVER01a]MDZ8051990.1 class I SAM-dependent methyltransferase [Aulosira sp. ZfuCHP01]
MTQSVMFNLLYERTKKLYYSVVTYDYDNPIILDLLNKYTKNNKTAYRILDVGCGYGNKMNALISAGYKVLGVDINPQIIATNQKQGLNCVTVEEFLKNHNTEQFDIILMSHIIEHFHPSELKDFMDNYLDKLKMGGYLIIATPLLTDYFYDDFDHIKPYSPLSIIKVFGEIATQVQYYSRNKLRLTDLKFRRRHYQSTLKKEIYIRSWATRLHQIGEFISTLLCLISCGWLGKKDGWVGIFRKI